MEANKIKVVYTVVERGGKSFWIRIGIGSVNQDGSMNLKLDAVPVNGTLQVRDFEPREERPTHEPFARKSQEAATEGRGAFL
jgi:hypothetical protein